MDRGGGREDVEKQKLADKALVIQRDICFKLSKSQCSVKGQFLYSSEASTGEANRHFMFAVRNIFIITLLHQLHVLSPSDLFFPSDTVGRSEMSLFPTRNELFSLIQCRLNHYFFFFDNIIFSQSKRVIAE